MAVGQTDRIKETEIAHRRSARIGDRVRHMGHHHTGSATATIVGFRITSPEEGFRNIERPGMPWVKVIIDPDDPHEIYGKRPHGTWEWDWDRTVLTPS